MHGAGGAKTVRCAAIWRLLTVPRPQSAHMLVRAVMFTAENASSYRPSRQRCVSAEGEHVGPHARVDERALEGALAGAVGLLTDQLVHPRFGDRPFAGLVDVDAVVATRRPAVEAYDEADRRARGRRREDQVQIARLEAVRDRTPGHIEHGGLFADRPRAVQPPLIERQGVGGRVGAALAAGVADVGLRGSQRVPIGRLGEAAGVDVDRLLVDPEELLDRSLGLLVVALA